MWGREINPSIDFSNEELSVIESSISCKLSEAPEKIKKELFNRLIVYSGQKTESMEDLKELYLITMGMLEVTHGDFTLEEIEKAFVMAKKGSLQMKLFRELSYAQLCDVLIEYDRYKKETLGKYIKNQTLFLSNKKVFTRQEEIAAIIDFLIDAWDLSKRNLLSEINGSLLYEQLIRIGLINFSDEEKKEILEESLEITKNRLENRKLTVGKADRAGIDRVLKDLETKYTPELIIVCKKVGLRRFLQDCQLNDVTLENLKIKINETY